MQRKMHLNSVDIKVSSLSISNINLLLVLLYWHLPNLNRLLCHSVSSTILCIQLFPDAAITRDRQEPWSVSWDHCWYLEIGSLHVIVYQVIPCLEHFVPSCLPWWCDHRSSKNSEMSSVWSGNGGATWELIGKSYTAIWVLGARSKSYTTIWL